MHLQIDSMSVDDDDPGMDRKARDASQVQAQVTPGQHEPLSLPSPCALSQESFQIAVLSCQPGPGRGSRCSHYTDNIAFAIDVSQNLLGGAAILQHAIWESL